MLSQADGPRRLVAASGGNHGLAVAHVGHALASPTDISSSPDIASPVGFVHLAKELAGISGQ